MREIKIGLMLIATLVAMIVLVIVMGICLPFAIAGVWENRPKAKRTRTIPCGDMVITVDLDDQPRIEFVRGISDKKESAGDALLN